MALERARTHERESQRKKEKKGKKGRRKIEHANTRHIVKERWGKKGGNGGEREKKGGKGKEYAHTRHTWPLRVNAAWKMRENASILSM